MISFVIALLALVAGYFIYGKIVERVFAPDKRPTPATLMADGVDYMALPNWKVYIRKTPSQSSRSSVSPALVPFWTEVQEIRRMPSSFTKGSRPTS